MTKGAEWLRDFLRQQGVREPAARILWTLGMRESGGNPDLICSAVVNTLRPDQVDPNSSSQRYDVGVWQINSSHLQEVKRVFGSSANMLTLLDPVKNFQYVQHLSKNFTDWTPWALNPDGYTFNWRHYPDDYVAEWGARIEANHHRIWETYPGLRYWDGVVASRIRIEAARKMSRANSAVWRLACKLFDDGYGSRPLARGAQKYPVEAVKELQRDCGLPVTGKFDLATAEAAWRVR